MRLAAAGVQPHPLDPLLATSGIDYDVKLWAPLAPQATLDQSGAEEVSPTGGGVVCHAPLQRIAAEPPSWFCVTGSGRGPRC